jgi:hypothetical protein
MALIPDNFFDGLYETVKAFILEHQGPEGYIDTQSMDGDTIYCYVYFGDILESREMRIHAVRVNPDNGEVEVIYDCDVNGLGTVITYDEAYLQSPQAQWVRLRDDEDLHYEPALVNIARHIEDYI